MKIIVLQGMPNTGKTSTLNLLYNMIISSGGISYGHRVVLGNPKQNDFSEEIAYCNIIVEFFTMGDYPQELTKAIQKAANRRNIGFFICACSLLDKMLIKELQSHRTVFISKVVSLNSTQQIAFNTADAQTIFNLI